MSTLRMRASTRTAARHRILRRFAQTLLASVFALPLIVGAIGPGSSPAAADDLSDARARQAALAREIADQRKKLAELTSMDQSLQSQIASTKSSLATVSQNLGDVQRGIVSLRAQVAKVQAKYDDLVAQLAGLQNQLADVEAREAAKAAELRERQKILGERLVAAYEEDQTPLLEQLLTAQSLTDVLGDVSSYMDMGQEDRQLAGQIVHDQETLAALHKTVLDTRDATAQMRAQTAAQKVQLDKGLADLKASEARLAQLQAQMQRQLAAQNAAEAKLVENKAALAAAIRSNGAAQDALAHKIQALIAAQQARLRVPPASHGPLAWPMGGVITQEFGCTGVLSEPPLGSCPHFHQAIDIAAPYGTPVHASAAGTVVFVGFNPYDAPPQAWIVIIAHSSRLQTWYAHMEPVRPAGVAVGAFVQRGQVIGYEGMTGHTSGPHLDWRVMQNGIFVNPRLLL